MTAGSAPHRLAWLLPAAAALGGACAPAWSNPDPAEFEAFAAEQLVDRITTELCQGAQVPLVLHLLRPGDLFLDLGSNVGSYTVLAGAVAGADVIAVEPVPVTLAVLRDNADVQHRVLLEAIARLPQGDLPENHSLASAMVTSLDRVPAATLERLQPFLLPYMRRGPA